MIAIALLQILVAFLVLASVAGAIEALLRWRDERRRSARVKREYVPPPPRSQHHGIRQYEINQRAYKSMR